MKAINSRTNKGSWLGFSRWRLQSWKRKQKLMVLETLAVICRKIMVRYILVHTLKRALQNKMELSVTGVKSQVA